MNFTTTAYDARGINRYHETSNDYWKHTELCIQLADQYGYAETLNEAGTHYGEYGIRPNTLGKRVF